MSVFHVRTPPAVRISCRCVQVLDSHWALRSQAAPSAWGDRQMPMAGSHQPSALKRLASQSASVWQLTLQTRASGLAGFSGRQARPGRHWASSPHSWFR